MNDSRPSDRLAALAAERERASESLDRLEEAITDLEAAASLRPDGAARLDKYRQNRQRIRFKLHAVDREIHELTSEHGDRATALSDEMLERVQKETKKQGWLRS